MTARSPSSERHSAAETARGIRIYIVDDHPLMRDGLAARIGQEPDMKICGEADSVGTALTCLEQANADVVIVDLTLKGRRHGLELIKQIHARDATVKVLVLSAHSERLYGERVLRLGALGFVNKQQAQTSLVSAIRCVAAGKRYLSEHLAQRLLEHAIGGRSGESNVEDLSDRELQVFERIGSGRSTREIAEELRLSIHTIETYRENIRAKLNLKNGSQLVQRAVHWRIENRPT